MIKLKRFFSRFSEPFSVDDAKSAAPSRFASASLPFDDESTVTSAPIAAASFTAM